MKQILGDNQFFGVNHYDLEKGERQKHQFEEDQNIYDFIKEALSLGLDGFMLNSNSRGFNIIKSYEFPKNKEIHYSMPYPHKYATMVNENGMLQSMNYFLKQASGKALTINLPQFMLTRNVKHLILLATDLEIPKNLPKNSYVYLHNIVTDLLIGINRNDLIAEFCKVIHSKGYKPGLITLNPLKLRKVVNENLSSEIKKELVICFNINSNGFNVYPSNEEVEEFMLDENREYKLMGMNILASGGVGSIEDSLNYIKKFNLDYVVYGSSKLKNVQSNFQFLSN